MTKMTLAVVCVLASGCSHQTRSEAPQASAAMTPRRAEAPTGRDAPEAPLASRWDVVSESGGQLRLDAHVVVRAPLPSDVTVRVEVPQGVTMVSGEPSYVIPANTAPGDLVRPYGFSYQQKPAGDLKLIAEVAGAAYSVHAADAYRFGRPEHVVQPPERTGPAVQIGGADVGPAIQIPAR